MNKILLVLLLSSSLLLFNHIFSLYTLHWRFLAFPLDIVLKFGFFFLFFFLERPYKNCCIKLSLKISHTPANVNHVGWWSAPQHSNGRPQTFNSFPFSSFNFVFIIYCILCLSVSLLSKCDNDAFSYIFLSLLFQFSVIFFSFIFFFQQFV